MKLFLLRHAEASYDATSDDTRELTPHGIETINKLTKHLSPKQFNGLQAIHHSGLVRANQTAHIVNEQLGLDLPLIKSDHLRPEDDPYYLTSFLLSSSCDLMLTGHNPNLSYLCALLLTGDATLPCIDFKKTGLLCLERLSTQPDQNHPTGYWALRFYLTPASLRG